MITLMHLHADIGDNTNANTNSDTKATVIVGGR